MIGEVDFKTSVSKVEGIFIVILAKLSLIEAGVIKSIIFLFVIVSVITKLLLFKFIIPKVVCILTKLSTLSKLAKLFFSKFFVIILVASKLFNILVASKSLLSIVCF